MIEIIDLKQEKQNTCRVMVCQMNSFEFNWKQKSGLHFLSNDEKIALKVKEFLKIAKQNSVDLILFPELSIPEKLIERIQEWSREQESIVICGSHYYENAGHIISRCPVIIKGHVYFTEKKFPSPLEKSPIFGEGISGGTKILKFLNSFIGDFSVLICADYLEENLKKELDLETLDLLCVCAFQRDSTVYHNRMNIDCENSSIGIYILYSNFIDKKYGDGKSAIFGIMDRMYVDKLFAANYTDLLPNKKLFQFKDDSEFVVSDLDMVNKRPFANRNILTEPNFHLLSTNTQTSSKDLAFIQKVAHDDERYKRIDELYVPPTEFNEILEILETKNIVFIIGDPGIGKTYTAVKILKDYFNKGFDPIWFAGLEKEERELQSKVLQDFTPTENQVVYFEDPFGRTTFERRDSLFQIFNPLLDKLSSLNCKIIITSRKEIFEIFSQESLLEKEILSLKQELNIRNPSYDINGLTSIFDKLASITCDWYEDSGCRDLVYSAIRNGEITTPLSIRDLVFVSRNVYSKQILKEQIERRSSETIKVFALEILSSSATIKTILYLTYFCGTKGKPYLSEIFSEVAKQLISLNIPIKSLSLNIEIRSQIGYRIEQFGFAKTAYKFSHPIYEESLSNLILSDSQCEIIGKTIIQEIANKNVRTAYQIINKNVIKYPEVTLLLFTHILEINTEIHDINLKLTLGQKLISTYYNTKNQDFFNLATRFYPLKTLIDDINNSSDYSDLTQELLLCLRYMKNSPVDFDSSLIKKIQWERILALKNTHYSTASKLLHFLFTSVSINPKSLSIFIEKKGTNIIKKMYFLLDDNDRKRLYNLLKGQHVQRELVKYKQSIEGVTYEKSKRKSLLRKVIFSDCKYSGILVIDTGAKKAISKHWLNLLPAGILKITGHFPAGSIVGVFDEQKTFLGVGVIEYSSRDLSKIIGHSSGQFNELIGYHHTSSAIKADFLQRFRFKEGRKWTLEDSN